MALQTESGATVGATERSSRWSGLVSGGWSGLAIALGLFILAVAVRWWGLPAQSRAMWGDEAQFMGEARKFIQGVYTSPFIIDLRGLPALYDFVLSFPLRLAGHMDVTVARGFDGVLGALSAPLLYLTARELGYARRVGVVAGVAVATTFWDVSFSRLVLPNIMAVAAASAAILLTAMAVRRSSPILAVLAGLAVAWTATAHLSGMVLAPVVAVWLALLVAGYSRWWQARHSAQPERQARPSTHSGVNVPDASAVADPLDVQRTWRRIIAFWRGSGRGNWLDLNDATARLRLPTIVVVAVVLCISALVFAWPLLALYFAPDSALRAHAADRYILSAANRAAFAAMHPEIGSSLPGLLWYQVKATAGLFTVRGEPSPLFDLNGRPLLDPFSGALFMLGAASALWTWRRPASTLALLWLIGPLITGTLLTTGTFPGEDPPSIHRSIVAAPAMCLLIALGLETVLAALGEVVGAMRRSALWWPRLRLVIAVAAAVGIGTTGVNWYWAFADSPVTRVAFHANANDWAHLISTRGAVNVTVLGPQGWPGEYAQLYAPSAHICAGRWNDMWSTCPPSRVVIFDTDNADAQRYGALTHLRVRAGFAPDGTVSFRYVEGKSLPDPANILHQ